MNYFSLMAGVEPLLPEIGGNRSTNCATTTAALSLDILFSVGPFVRLSFFNPEENNLDIVTRNFN